MKIIFLQELTGGLFGGLLKGLLLNGRLKGLFTRTPVLAVLLLTAVVAACASDDSKSGGPPPPKADCVLAEDVGNATDCGLLALPQTFDYPTTYNITVGEVLAGRDVNTDKLGVSNFTFTQIINGNISDPKVVTRTNNQIELLANATALNLNISGIADNVFGEFYIDLDLVLVNNSKTTVKVRYTISITPVNDAPVFSLPSYSFADIPFNSTTGYSVGNVSATDVDNDAITYGIDGGTDDIDLFQISSTGEITLKKVAVNPGNSPIEYTFNVTASDSKGGSARIEVTVKVLPNNQGPVFRAGNSPGVQFTNATGATPANYTFAAIPFNSPAGYSVGNVSAMDPDGDTVSYNISGEDDDNNLFRINSATGEITLKVTADTAVNSGNYTFNVTANDGKGGSAIATISVEVLPNQAPVFRAGNSPGVQFTNATGTIPANYTFAAIPFNSPANDLVGNVSAMDPDGDTVSYNISGGDDDNDLFQINLTTGVITLKVTADTAVNSGNYTFNVTASDGNGGSAIAIISVEVLPNQAPVFEEGIGSGQFTPVSAAGTTPANYDFDGIPFNSPTGHSVGNVSAMDPDGDTVSYNISGGDDDNDLFQISSTGEITLLAVADTLGEYTFNITANDGKGGTATATISVHVDGSAPVFTQTPYNFNLDLSVANAAGVVVDKVSAMDNERTLFTYSLAGSGDLFDDLFELAANDNADGSRNIVLRRAVTIDDLTEFPVTFQVEATHQVGGLSSDAAVTVNLNNDLPPDDDSDGDGIANFYDADPNDPSVNVNGSGEPSDPYIISNIYQLQAIAGVDHTGTALDSSISTSYVFLYGTDAADQLTKHYMLANDIDASNTTDTDIWAKPMVEDYEDGHGWTPIAGKSGQSFSGSFSGEGYAINNLNILARQSDNSKHFGLFGINNGNITALGVENINMRIEAPGNAYTKSTTIYNITLGSHTGMLAALNQEDGIIIYSYTTGYVNASLDAVGGLVGVNEGEISYSYSAATQVEGEGDTGGLVGANERGAILSSYVGTVCVRSGRGIVGGNGASGGLVGSISGEGAIIKTSYILLGAAGSRYNDDDFAVAVVAGERDDDRLGGSNVTIESTYWRGFNTKIGVDRERKVGKNEEREGDNTGATQLKLDQLQGCKLDGVVIEGASPAPTTCAGLFPASGWGNTTDSAADITRGWIFTANQEPSLSAVRSSDNRQFFPTTAQQQESRSSARGNGCGN